VATKLPTLSALRHYLYYGIYRASHLAAWMSKTRSGPGAFISTGVFTEALIPDFLFKVLFGEQVLLL
jgi:hypothetical protein